MLVFLQVFSNFPVYRQQVDVRHLLDKHTTAVFSYFFGFKLLFNILSLLSHIGTIIFLQTSSICLSFSYLGQDFIFPGPELRLLTDADLNLDLKHTGLRIRIPIGSGFNRVSGSGSGSRRAKMSHKSKKKKKSCFEAVFRIITF